MHHASSSKQNLIYALALCIAHMAGISANALAQTAPITSSGLNTQISAPISVGGQVQYDITGGTRPNGGANLFHSFGEFGVPNNAIANFHNNSGLATSNILGRVTGGNESQILGTIRTTEFSGANLFLMNPAGFLFGPNATVSVDGMMTFTTADYIRLSNGTTNGYFYADPAGPSLLSASPVAAFGFLGSNPGAIRVQGSHFAVKEGTGIALVGGNISIESSTLTDGTVQRAILSAPDGKIQLVSTASPGEFDATPQATPTVNTTSLASFGAISLTLGSRVDISGTDVVSIRGGQFVLSASTSVLTTDKSTGTSRAISLSPGSSIVSSNSSPEAGADIQITAKSLHVDGSQVISLATGSGGSGNITIQSETVSLQGGTRLSSSTSASGDSGMITVDATTSLSLVNSFIVNNSDTSTSIPLPGNGGQVKLFAPTISLQEGSGILARTAGAGRAGTIQLNTNYLGVSDHSIVQTSTNNVGAAGSLTVQGLGGDGTKAQSVSVTGGSSLSSASLGNDEGNGGAAGNILIETQTLNVSGNSEITTSSSTSSGDAGLITIHAGKAITLSQSNLLSKSQSNIPDEFVRDVVIGNAGSIVLSAPTISLKHGSRLASTTDSRYPGDPSKGNGGSITISSSDLRLTEGSQVISSSIIGDSGQPPVGNAGIVTIQGLHGPAQSVYIDGHASGIFTDTQGSGLGGNISINANAVTLKNGGTLSAQTSGTTDSAVGGTISVNASEVRLSSGATITANSTGAADAGNISITATDALRLQNSSITTQVVSNGTASNSHGGNIKITTSPSAMVHITNSTISASVPGNGDGGNISIDPKFVILQGSQILAQTDRGTGGNISITASVFQPDATSIVNADSGSGVNGTVTIQSPIAPASGKIQPIGNRPLHATSLLNQRCAALGDGKFSSFTIAGRPNLPPEPRGWLSSPSTIVIPPLHDSAMTETGSRMSLTSVPRGELSALSIRQIVPTGFLTQAFAIDQSMACGS